MAGTTDLTNVTEKELKGESEDGGGEADTRIIGPTRVVQSDRPSTHF
jgi:hypothetical protein